MATLVYTHLLALLFGPDLDLVADDVRAALLMTDTTADAQDDATTLADFTTLDRYDGAGYADKVLGSKIVSEDPVAKHGEFDAADVTWAALAAGSRAAKGVLLYKRVTSDADSIPLAWIVPTGFPVTGNGGDLLVRFNVDGVLQTRPIA